MDEDRTSLKGYTTHEVLVSSVPKRVKKALNGTGKLPLYQGRVSAIKPVKVGAVTDSFLMVDWSTVTPYTPKDNVIPITQPLPFEDEDPTVRVGFDTYTETEFRSFFRGVRCYSCAETLPFADGNVPIDSVRDVYCCVDCSSFLMPSEVENLKANH